MKYKIEVKNLSKKPCKFCGKSLALSSLPMQIKRYQVANEIIEK